MALPIDKDYLLTQLKNFKLVILDPAYIIQKASLPTANADNAGKIFQYIGSDSTNYTIGGFYQCQEVTPATDPATYHWVEVSTKTLIDDETIKRDDTTKELYVPKGSSSALGVFKAGGGLSADSDGVLSADVNVFNGTIDEYEALSADEKKKYSHIASPDEATSDVADAVTNGDMRPVTSNAVFDLLRSNSLSIKSVGDWRILDLGNCAVMTAYIVTSVDTENAVIVEPPIGYSFVGGSMHGFVPGRKESMLTGVEVFEQGNMYGYSAIAGTMKISAIALARRTD